MVKTTMPPSSIARPSQDTILNCSPMKNTPRMAAVNGSANDSVTAEDELIFADHLKTINTPRLYT